MVGQGFPDVAGAVSVVVPHYGDAAPTVELATALLRQEGVNEVIVVDDSSPVPFPAVEGVLVIRRTRNGGFGAAVNSGAAAARSELLLILNSDVNLHPGFVRALLTAAAPWQPALVGPAIRTGGVTDHTARHFPRPRYQAVERVRILTRFHGTRWFARAIGQDLRARPGEDRPVDWVAGVCLLVPRAAFDRVGGFDERFFMYAEEVDLQRRLADIGVPRVYVGSVTLDHVGGGSSDPARVQGWLADSRLAYADKWGGGRRLRTLLTAAAFLNAATDGARRVAGRDVRPLTDLSAELRQVWNR